MSTLLVQEIRDAGFTILGTPDREPRYTRDELKLAQRLADPKTGDVREPRIQHDVDCIAGVLTYRRGAAADRIENAKAVFVTTSPTVLKHTRDWWARDEEETTIPPIVHVRALANLAWLKRPRTNPGFLLKDFVALCAAAMKPAPRTWSAFVRHLERLRENRRLTQDQVTAVIASAMSDQLLKAAEIDSGDPDAVTLDEVVDRVMETYSHQADERVRVAEARATNAYEELRRRDLANAGRARRWAQLLVGLVYYGVTGLAAIASINLILRNQFSFDWVGIVLGAGFVVLVLLETLGFAHQLGDLRRRAEAWLRRLFESFLASN